MSELKTRISLLYRTYDQWSAYTSEFVPLKGEVCYCEIPKGKTVEGIDTSEDRIMIKVGDGSTPFPTLKWVSAKPSSQTGKYRLHAESDSKWVLQFSTDSGTTWTTVEGDAVDFTTAMARITALESSVALKADKTYVDEELAKIIALSEQEIKDVIDK